MSQNIAVIGAGICGLCTALSLSRQGHNITVFERDVPPPEGGADEAFFEWKRRGAAQFRHPHAFLGLMCNILQDNYPDLVEEFWQAGARKVTLEEMLPEELANEYSEMPGDEKLWLLMCRRATIETVLRRYVARQNNVTINNTSNVTGVVVDRTGDIPVVQGVKITRRETGEETFLADVVIDAGGRTSRFKEWLEDLGASVELEKEDAEIVYYTRHYKFLPGVKEPERDPNQPSSGDIGYMKYGIFPGDNGHFALIICVPDGETELREAIKDGEKYDAIARSIPGLDRWLAADKAEATTVSFGFADISAVWKHFVSEEKPVALNFFAVGDAAVRTNPLYGRGCSIGIMHAHLLADVFAESSDPIERALIYDKRTEEEIRPIYKTSLAEDKRGIKRAKAVMEGKDLDEAENFKQYLGLAFGDAIGAAARDHLHVLRGTMRTFNLLEKPGDFLKDWRIRLTILRYMFRGRKKNASARLRPGPSRDEMMKLIRSLSEERTAA